MVIKFDAGINIEIADECVVRWEQTDNCVRVLVKDDRGFRTLVFDKTECNFFVEAPQK